MFKAKLSTVLFVCAGFLINSPSFAQPKTSVEIQALQSRIYEYNERGTIRAVLAVLQNNKFENIRSDSNSGLITAELPPSLAGDTVGEQNAKAVAGIVLGAIIPFGGFLAPEQRTGTRTRTLSAVIEELSANRTNVRILLKETEKITKVGFLGATSEEIKENDMTSQPRIYQGLFEQIDKEIFIRQNR